MAAWFKYTDRKHWAKLLLTACRLRVDGGGISRRGKMDWHAGIAWLAGSMCVGTVPILYLSVEVAD